MKEVTYIEMNHNELDRIIQKHYNKPDFSSIAMEEWGNDQSYNFYLNGKLDKWDEKDL
jgi:hypothetical protein